MVCGDCIDMTSGTVAMSSAVSAKRRDGCHARRGVFGKNSATNEIPPGRLLAPNVSAAAGMPQPALCISIRIAPAIAACPDRSATLRIVCGALQSTEPKSIDSADSVVATVADVTVATIAEVSTNVGVDTVRALVHSYTWIQPWMPPGRARSDRSGARARKRPAAAPPGRPLRLT